MTEVSELLREQKRENTESITTRCGSEVKPSVHFWGRGEATGRAEFPQEAETERGRFASTTHKGGFRVGASGRNGVPAKVVGDSRAFVGKRRSNRTDGVFAKSGNGER